ncbi:MAG TPA: VanZ family protein [Candidatus Udaeobacter sp.]|nr:VanZ family protein [Candidatus Udaeobacter sp.]
MRFLVVLAYIGGMFALSSWHHPPSVTKVPYADKVVHTIEYGILGGLATWALPLGMASAQRIVSAIGLGLAVGAADETYQKSVPGRESSLRDLVADVVGVSLGALLREQRQRHSRIARKS